MPSLSQVNCNETRLTSLTVLEISRMQFLYCAIEYKNDPKPKILALIIFH